MNPNLAHTDTWQDFETEVFRIEAVRLACTAGTSRPLADQLRSAFGNVDSIRHWKSTVEPRDPIVVLAYRLPFVSAIKPVPSCGGRERRHREFVVETPIRRAPSMSVGS